jgi:hypothetical protein
MLSESTNPQYCVIWYSPLKFANVGVYYYGTMVEADALHEAYDPYKSACEYVSYHDTLMDAKQAAQRCAKSDYAHFQATREGCCMSAKPTSQSIAFRSAGGVIRQFSLPA